LHCKDINGNSGDLFFNVSYCDSWPIESEEQMVFLVVTQPSTGHQIKNIWSIKFSVTESRFSLSYQSNVFNLSLQHDLVLRKVLLNTLMCCGYLFSYKIYLSNFITTAAFFIGRHGHAILTGAPMKANKINNLINTTYIITQ
jgi:hypothetical protein